MLFNVYQICCKTIFNMSVIAEFGWFHDQCHMSDSVKICKPSLCFGARHIVDFQGLDCDFDSHEMNNKHDLVFDQ